MRRRFLCLLPVVIVCSTARAWQDKNALELLARSMRGDFGVNVVATMIQRDHRGPNVFERIKVMRSRSGKQHWRVLEPLSRAGIESVDDGKRWTTYLPDDRMIIDQESPGRNKADLKLRVDLARENYIFRIEDHGEVAGRSVVCVSAVPVDRRMDGRRYCLDLETAYPLRMETVSPSGVVTVDYDTKDVQFPPSIAPSALEMHPIPGVSRLSYQKPRTLNRKEARRMFNFDPILPRRLPLGFRFQEMQFSDSPEWKSIVIRLTDGLARANVYEWTPDGKPKKAMADSTSAEIGGVKLLLVSDNLTPELRRELLMAFNQPAD